MKDIDEIRRDNLKLLELELGGPAEAARALDMSLSQFANLRDGAKDSKTGKPRGMRKETARRIEASARKPAGWLDVDHSEPGHAKPRSAAPAPWAAYQVAPAATKAAVDLLLLPPVQRARLLAKSPQAMTAVELLETHAGEVMRIKKSA